MKKIYLSFVILVLSACSSAGTGENEYYANQPDLEVCTQEYAPVCGKLNDGVEETFVNECFAKNSRAEVLSKGTCDGILDVAGDSNLCTCPEGDVPYFDESGDCGCQKGSVDNDTYCTSEYVPVCATIQVQCVTTPCDPVTETFSNECLARKNGAIDITLGECK